ARCRRAPARASNVARSRTRQIRRRDAFGPGARRAPAQRRRALCAYPAGTQHGAAALGAHPEPETMGLGALAIVGLVRALHRKSPLEEVAPGPKWGTVREAETTQCMAPIRPCAMRSSSNRRSGRRLGKTPTTP